MSEPVPLDRSMPEHLVGPPIIDFLAYDHDLRAYVAEFVPDPQVSRERKESVYAVEGGATARRVSELMEQLSNLLNAPSPVIKLAHAGGDDFDFYTKQGEHIELHASPSPQASFDAYLVLQVLSQEIQLEFISQRRIAGRAAG